MALDGAPKALVPPGSILLNKRPRKPTYRGVSIVQQRDDHDGGTPCHTWVVLPQADVYASALYPLASNSRLYLTLSMSQSPNLRSRRARATQQRSSKDQNAPMDPLELADLNSIINTRKSMASAKALAKQELDAARPTPGHASRLVKFAPLPQVEEDMFLDEDDDSSSCDTPSERTLHRHLSVPRRDRLSDTESDTRGRSLVRSWSPFRRHSNDVMSCSPSPTRVTFAEERNRCRELVRATRPGGTGMVTLLDGQRIPARQVGEVPGDDGLSPDLWGFAALERRRTAPKTKSEQAEEVQRRYKQEMAALGAEVLSNVRDKATRLRRSQSSPPSTSQRIRVDPTVSIPSPSPRLPRRPDARGIAVVPLPELGLRPRYPREGRSCISDWLDDDDDENDEEQRPARRRATTRAAGQEVYMSHKPRKDEWDDEYWPKPSATRRIGTGIHGT